VSETGHERWNDEVAAYMLGALEPHEVEKLERHLERCELCRDQMRWLRPAVGALPESVERLGPPPGLRDRVLGEAEIRPRSSAPLRGLRGRARAWLGGFGSRGRGWRPAFAAAASLLAVGAVMLIAFEIGRLSGDYVPPTSTARAGEAPAIAAEVVREGSHGTLRLENVPPLEDGKVLEAWVQRGKVTEAVPALFVPNRERRAWTMIEGMRGVDAVLVTEESRGGSEVGTPTSGPLVRVEMPAEES